MKLHFKDIFYKYAVLLFSLALFVFYVAVSILSYLPGYCISMMPQVSVNELATELQGTIFLLTLFSLGITVFISQFISIISNLYMIRHTKKDVIFIVISKNHVLDIGNLDISNPFLYSSKTKSLLE